MIHELPYPIGRYYEAKNRQDIDTMIRLFADDAVVVDEGSERRGHDEIYEWMTKTTKLLSVQSDIVGLERADGREIVSATISGDFKGSPITLRYGFTLTNGRIARLEIV